MTARPAAVTPADRPVLRLLRGWDVRRARAYAAGSPRLLRELYAHGSSAGDADVRVLRGYRARGYRVVGMRMQLLAATVLERRRDRWRVQVTDRLGPAVAVGRGRRVLLPHDRASTHLLTWVRDRERDWVLAAVTGPG